MDGSESAALNLMVKTLYFFILFFLIERNIRSSGTRRKTTVTFTTKKKQSAKFTQGLVKLTAKFDFSRDVRYELFADIDR